MKKVLVLLLLLGLVCSCQSTPSEVIQKVKYDFGIGEKPEGYVTGTELVMANLRKVGESELKRMNMAGRHGEVKFQEEAGLQGKFYKEVKVYDNCYPLDARAVAKAAEGDRGYIGLIEYSYRIYQSERFNTRTEAEAASASIPTDISGRETYRYRFTAGGIWDGSPGELTK